MKRVLFVLMLSVVVGCSRTPPPEPDPDPRLTSHTGYASLISDLCAAAADPSLDYQQLARRACKEVQRRTAGASWPLLKESLHQQGLADVDPEQKGEHAFRYVVSDLRANAVPYPGQLYINLFVSRPNDPSGEPPGIVYYPTAGLTWTVNERLNRVVSSGSFASQPHLSRLLGQPSVTAAAATYPIVRSMDIRWGMYFTGYADHVTDGFDLTVDLHADHDGDRGSKEMCFLVGSLFNLKTGRHPYGEALGELDLWGGNEYPDLPR